VAQPLKKSEKNKLIKKNEKFTYIKFHFGIASSGHYDNLLMKVRNTFAWRGSVIALTIAGAVGFGAPAKAGETTFGHLNRVTTSTMNVSGTSWTDYTKVLNSTQVDLASDQPATMGFNVSGSVTHPTFEVWGQAGSAVVDPVIQLNISTAQLTEKGGSNLNLSGVTQTTESLSGVYGVQSGTNYP
jgi:hypothetical protein